MTQSTIRRMPPMRVVIVPEGGAFVAYCVEFNICCHGETVDAARVGFVDALIRYVLVHEQVGRDPFAEPRGEDSPAHQLWRRVEREGAARGELHVPNFTTSRRGAVERVEAASVSELVAPAAA